MVIPMAPGFRSEGTPGALLAIRRVKTILADPTAGKVFGSQCVGTAGAGANSLRGRVLGYQVLQKKCFFIYLLLCLLLGLIDRCTFLIHKK